MLSMSWHIKRDGTMEGCCHLEAKPVDALEVDHVAVGAYDVGSRQRQRLLRGLMTCCAVAAEPQCLAANIDENASFTIQEDAARNQRRSCGTSLTFRGAWRIADEAAVRSSVRCLTPAIVLRHSAQQCNPRSLLYTATTSRP